ncbi:hypothetical protein [Halococcus salifodinae]|uniref:Uncharacterized protein n=1 Tax=Halococcus salifodinae DSM 8989 TaxID=1227456 RepID=M0ND23_9EURY|nr:hypothetical protein [Halococcus salifodinae]EMA55882.1 hypothetical protein C450_00120 [Halococcus salifodinae DSM 8989]
MAAFDDLDEVSMDEQQVETFDALSQLFDELAALAEEGFPGFDQAAREDGLDDITATETAFATVWADLKACVATHLEVTACDDSLDRDMFDSVSVTGHPPSDETMTLTVRYAPQGFLEVDIDDS